MKEFRVEGELLEEPKAVESVTDAEMDEIRQELKRLREEKEHGDHNERD